MSYVPPIYLLAYAFVAIVVCTYDTHSRSPPAADGRQKSQKVLEQVEEVKGIMHNNIDGMKKSNNIDVVNRHEKMSEIQGKAGTFVYFFHPKPKLRNC
jgi:hypothetical protein